MRVDGELKDVESGNVEVTDLTDTRPKRVGHNLIGGRELLSSCG